MNMVQKTQVREEALNEIIKRAQQTLKSATDVGSDNGAVCVSTRESLTEIFFGDEVCIAGGSFSGELNDGAVSGSSGQSTSRASSSASDDSANSGHSKQQVSFPLIECPPLQP